MKKSLGTGFLILLFLFIGAGLVSGDPGPKAAEVRAVQNVHLKLYEEHLVRLDAGGFDCR